MKVFFLSYWFPYPPDNGARLRVFNFIKGLSRAGHEVHLISLLQRDSDPSQVNVLSQWCRTVSLHPMPKVQRRLDAYLGFFHRRPRSVVATFDEALLARVQGAIQGIRPDCIVVSMVDLAEYVTFGQADAPKVLIDHNCEFGVIRRRARRTRSTIARLRYELTWRKYAAWEAQLLRCFDRVVMPADRDQRLMEEFAPEVKNISVIPNAADTDYYEPVHWRPEPNSLVYSGSLSYGPNWDAVQYFKRDIYPILQQSVPNARLLVTGRHENLDLAAFEDCPGIAFTGYVKDIRSILYRSACCIVPLRHGGGMRLKIPEAMAAGVPVVSTSVGAEGLQCRSGVHLLIADTPTDFAAAIVRVLRDPDTAATLRRNARALVEERYSWQRSARLFVELLESMRSDGRRHSHQMSP